MSAWVKPTSYAGLKWPTIYSYGHYRASMGLSRRRGGDRRPHRELDQRHSVRQSNTAVTLNAWNYVTISRTATTTSFYLNGSADGSGTSTAVTTAGQASGIGSYVTASPNQFLGLIDEVRVSMYQPIGRAGS